MFTKAVESIKSKITGELEIGIILGSGLGTLGEKMQIFQTFLFQQHPDTWADLFSVHLMAKRLCVCRAEFTFTRVIQLRMS